MSAADKKATPTGVTLSGYRGEATHYVLSEPLGGHTYVVVSAAVVPFSGPETYIFPATPDGDIEEWAELPGSYRGGLSHHEALLGAGYEVTR